MLRTLKTRYAILRLAILVPVVFLFLFLFVERGFITNIIAGDFPLWLFSRILPSLAYDFLFSNIALSIHYTLISILLSIYLLLVVHVFRNGYVSAASIGTSALGLVGITIGVSCISCGALAGIFLVSALGAFSLPLTLIHSNMIFLVTGEILLSASIGLVLYTIARFENGSLRSRGVTNL